MSMTDVDRLAAALLTLLQITDTKSIEDSSSALLVNTDERKTRQHLPLSAAVSLPSSIASRSATSRRQWRHSSVEPGSTALWPPSLDEQGGRATTVTSARYKTELCRAYAEHGTCRYGDKCQFAHGRADLRALARHPKYKTDLCRTYHTTGLCPYGPRCHFIHNEDEARRPPTARPPQRDVDIAVRELESRLALLNVYQQEKSAASSHFYFDHTSDQSSAAAVAPRWHVPLDRRHSVPATVLPSSTLMGASSPAPVTGALDSVGGSPSSSAADDDSPPPLSPTVGAADDAYRRGQMVASNDRLTALLVLAARLRLLQATTTATR